jgi:hypothetical protein
VTRFWFPDNTVLCNFAAIQELDVLAVFLDGRGRWVEAVAAETTESVKFYPQLAEINWLGDPIEIDDPQIIEKVESIRRAVFGGTARQPRKHLGEAQTCWLLYNEGNLRESVWITDDRQAFTYGERQGIRTLTTVDLISEAIARADLTPASGWELLARMVDAERDNIRLPRSPRDLV